MMDCEEMKTTRRATFLFSVQPRAKIFKRIFSTILIPMSRSSWMRTIFLFSSRLSFSMRHVTAHPEHRRRKLR